MKKYKRCADCAKKEPCDIPGFVWCLGEPDVIFSRSKNRWIKCPGKSVNENNFCTNFQEKDQ